VQVNQARQGRGARSIRRPSFHLEFLEDRNLLSTAVLTQLPPADVQAATQFVPQSGTINGVATLTLPPTIDPYGNVIVHVSSTGTGNVSQLGLVTLTETHDTVILASSRYTTSLLENGEATITAANGDQLYLDFTGMGVLVAPHQFQDTINYTIEGGTGRFEDASGSGVINSTDETPISATEIPFVFDLVGVISTVGSKNN
jgi:hypothetical protein